MICNACARDSQAFAKNGEAPIMAGWSAGSQHCQFFAPSCGDAGERLPRRTRPIFGALVTLLLLAVAVLGSALYSHVNSGSDEHMFGAKQQVLGWLIALKVKLELVPCAYAQL